MLGCFLERGLFVGGFRCRLVTALLLAMFVCVCLFGFSAVVRVLA